ncbi:hypothetical protein SAMN06295945_1405 [Polynucleobacter meluiroseus]|uniref:Glycosyl transferase family 8 n=1 Tax=Polynucleobacter meluiroseus TaxID=1938814 RepID=A0A240E1F6_9BURK|nr:DUF6492 family protein [Polynucleobacter meluiroseus]SNX29042.1 hypothetical protein SAMN06295945_1405 [Polynucleobacter meluiroseus]
MKDLVLYCKSYRRDFLRLKRLLNSIKKYNVDQIPFYISCPQEQYAELIKIMGSEESFHWVSDEAIIASNPRVAAGIEKTRSGGLSQQAIKSEFWRLGISENYVCLDSDCIFIKDFGVSDFLASDGNPYTVIYQNKEFFQLAINRGENQVTTNLKKEGDLVKALFDRKGPNYYCPCPPFIWSAKVWRSLDESYLQPRNMSFWDISTGAHPESLLYLEALLNFRAIPLYPIEQLFRIYYYSWQYYLLKRVGENQEKIAENYLGVIYQSNWDSGMDYGVSQKPFLSRILKKIKSFLRYLQSFT